MPSDAIWTAAEGQYMNDSDEVAQLALRILQDGWKQVPSQPRLPSNVLQTQVTEMDCFSDSGGWNLRLRYRSGWLHRGCEAVREGSIVGPTPGCIHTVFTLYLSLISPLSLFLLGHKSC